MRIIKFLSIVVSIFLSTNTLAINFLWNGSQNTLWTNSSNWTPNGVPATTDSVRIVTTSKHPQLQSNVTIKRLTMTSGTLNLNGYTLYITNESRYPGGTITNGTLNLRGTSVYFEGATLNCSIDAILGLIYFNGSIFNQGASFEQTGTTSGWGTGGNTFNANVTIKNAGTAYLRLGNNNPDVFNGTTTLKNTGAYPLQIGFGSAATFNGNLIVENTGGGIAFGTGTSSGAAILSSSKTITVGSGGFSSGTLTLMNFTQQGSTSQSLTATGTAIINVVGSTFNGATVITSPGILTKTSTFNSSFELIKTGTASNFSDGGNTFNGATIIRNNASNGASIRLALQTGDVFNGDVSFITTTGNIQIAYAGITEFKGNISLNNSLAYFNVGSGTVKFSGSANQQLNGSVNYLFNKVEVNKTAGDVTLNRSAIIDTLLNLVKGVINTSSTNLLTLKASSTTTGGNNMSFISGPLRKTGNTAYVFPIGKTGRYLPISISAPVSVSESFTGEVFSSEQTIGTYKDTEVQRISRSEYWSLVKSNSATSVIVKTSWDLFSTEVGNSSSATICAWNGTKWIDLGRATSSGDIKSGNITAQYSSSNVYFANGIKNNSTTLSVTAFENYGLFASGSVITNKYIVTFGKIGASYLDTAQVKATDSILTNYSGSTSILNNSFSSYLLDINSLKDTVYNPFSDSLILPNVYCINGNLNIQKSFTIPDTNQLYIFKIHGTLTLDEGQFVNSSYFYSNNIIWVCDSIVLKGGNNLYGTIISKNKIVVNGSFYGRTSVYSLNNIEFESGNLPNDGITFYAPLFYKTESQSQNSTSIICNLVNNPGFSCSNTSPSAYSNVGATISDVCNWFSPTNATPDYYNQNAIFNSNNYLGVPNSIFQGTTTPQINHGTYSGNEAYCGIYGYGGPFGGSNYREYLQSQLSSPLDTSKNYYSEFFVSLREGSGYAVRNLSAYFSPSRVTQASQGVFVPYRIPQIPQIPSTNLLSNTNTWERVYGCYKPSTFDRNITIGNFRNDIATNPVIINTNPLFNASYYFIDDVSVVEFAIDAGPDITVKCDVSQQLGTPSCLDILNTGQLLYNWTLIGGNPTAGILSQTNVSHPSITNTNFSNTLIIQRYVVELSCYQDCSTKDTVDVTLPPRLLFTGSSTTDCSNQSNGEIQLSISSGVAPFNIAWTNTGTGASSSFATTNFNYIINSLHAGNYTVIITDANGCTFSNSYSVSSSFVTGNITVTGTHTTNTNGSINICFPTTNTLTANANSGIAPYTYLWNNSTASTSQSITVSTTQNYTCIITDAFGCTTTVNLMVNVFQPSVTLSASPGFNVCEGTLLTLTANGTPAGGSYSWTASNSNVLSCYNCPITTVTANTNFSVQVTYIDLNGCQSSSGRDVVVIDGPEPPIVTGVRSACLPDGTVGIEEPAPNVSYTWGAFNNGVLLASGTGLGMAINSSWPAPITVVYTATSTITGCTSSTEWVVCNCCEADIYNGVILDISGRTYSELLNDPFYVNNSLVFFDPDCSCDKLTSTVNNVRYRMSINTTFVIDQNVDLVYAEFIMGPNAKIIVNPGVRFLIGENNWIHSCSDCMWDGIDVTGNSPDTYIDLYSGYTLIEDAINAISYTVPSFVRLGGGDFNRNYNNIVINGSTNTNINGFYLHRNLISNNTFRCSDGSKNTNLEKIPYVNVRTNTGILVKNVHSVNHGLQLIIGSALNNLFYYTGPNQFSNLDIGIQVRNSDVTIHNNIINQTLDPGIGTNVNNSTTGVNWGAGIDVFNNNYAGNVEIGGFNGTSGNNFQNVLTNNRWGIRMRGPLGWYNIVGNTIDASSVGGIESMNNISVSDLFAARNTISNCNRAFRIFNFGVNNPNSSLFINLNTIDVVESSTPSFFTAQPLCDGIIVNQTTTTNNQPRIQITNNIIGNTNGEFKNAIALTNLMGANVQNNNIHLQSQPIPRTNCGLWLSGCSNVSVFKNEFVDVSFNSSPTYSWSNPSTGVLVDMCGIGNSIADNSFFQVQSGLTFFGNLVYTAIECNKFNFNENSILLNSSYVGNQGSSTKASGNEWGSLGQPLTDIRRVIGNARTNWYVNSISSYPFAPLIQFPNILAVNSPANPVLTSSSPSPNCTPDPCPSCRTLDLVEGINFLNDTTITQISEKELMEQTIIEHLLRDSTLNDSTTVNDSLLLAYEIAIRSDKYQMLNAAEQVTKGDTSTWLFGQNISDNLYLDYYGKLFGNVKLALDNQDLIYSKDQVLVDLARSNAYVYGPIVFAARTLTGEEGEDYVPSSNLRVLNNDMATEKLQQTLWSKVVPNPNTGDFSIVSTGQIKEIVIYDLHGREVEHINFNALTNNYRFEEMLKEGVYIVRLMDEKGLINIHKVVVTSK